MDICRSLKGLVSLAKNRIKGAYEPSLIKQNRAERMMQCSIFFADAKNICAIMSQLKS
jgi:hypothetical protein